VPTCRLVLKGVITKEKRSDCQLLGKPGHCDEIPDVTDATLYPQQLAFGINISTYRNDR